jgi:general secretion pathway protein I
LSHSAAARRPTAGFTLIEVLIALSVLATLFASISAMIVTTARGTQSLERHVTQLETARAILTALPDRDQLVPGSSTGEVAGYRWRIDVAPMSFAELPALPDGVWLPENVVVTVRSPGGTLSQFDTIRLRRRPQP